MYILPSTSPLKYEVIKDSASGILKASLGGRKFIHKKFHRGRCQLCGRTDTEVIPDIITVGTECLSKLDPSAKVVGIGAWDFCQICGRYRAVVYKINVWLCPDCYNKIRKGKYGFDFETKRRIMQKYPKLFYAEPQVRHF